MTHKYTLSEYDYNTTNFFAVAQPYYAQQYHLV